MTHLIEAGKLSLEDVQQAEKLVRPDGANGGEQSVIAALLDHLWQSTLFAACVAALALLVRRQAARLRFALWLRIAENSFSPSSALVLLGRWLLRRCWCPVPCLRRSSPRPCLSPPAP